MGLFKPGWMNKDPEKRKKAIEKITRQDELKKIVLTDMSKSGLTWYEQMEIRAACFKRITDQIFLLQIAVNITEDQLVYQLGEAVLQNITDEMILLSLAMKHGNYIFAGKTAIKITNPDFLEMLAVDAGLCETVRVEAVRKLTNQQILSQIAVNDRNAIVAREALERITDDSVIARVAVRPQETIEKNKYIALRELAINKLTNQEILEQIGLDTKEHHLLRGAAIRRMQNQKALTKLTLHDDNPGLRQTAFFCITDQNCLKKIALSNDEQHAYMAVSKLTDDECLKNVFFTAATMSIRSIAAERMSASFRIELFDSLPADSQQDRADLLKKIKGRQAPISWWYRQLDDIALDSASHSWCLKQMIEDLGEISLLPKYIESNLDRSNRVFYETILKHCTKEIIDLLEGMVSAGNTDAAVIIRKLYMDKDLPESLLAHARLQKRRFQDIHEDGFPGECKGSEGHSDRIETMTIIPL